MSPVPYTIVDTEASLSAVLRSFNVSSVSARPVLYLDLEGINLCRHGSIAIMQVYQSEEDHVYLVDVHTLGAAAFSTTATDGVTTLKSVLENSSIPKAFFDVRNDSDALYNLYSIYLCGVVDVQLMELRTRTGSRRLLNGLARCLERYFTSARMVVEASEWNEAKQAGLRLFAPERGGSYQVNARPMRQAIVDYCIQDVIFLPDLYDLYAQGLTPLWRRKLDAEALRRVAVCQQQSYMPQGRHKACTILHMSEEGFSIDIVQNVTTAVVRDDHSFLHEMHHHVMCT